LFAILFLGLLPFVDLPIEVSTPRAKLRADGCNLEILARMVREMRLAGKIVADWKDIESQCRDDGLGFYYEKLRLEQASGRSFEMLPAAERDGTNGVRLMIAGTVADEYSMVWALTTDGQVIKVRKP
jgi:hypothetical protein